ncbi:MAG: sterol desaturase family protein [Candidatus Neomarinimicrobiota bacterium]
MNELIQFFTNITTGMRSSLILCGLLFFLFLESGIPLFRMEYNKIRHGVLNITFTIITLIINLIGAIGIMAAVRFNEINGTGLLNIIDLPVWLYLLIGLALMDLIGAWSIHWLEHKIRWMWKLHIIHHSDRNVDVTTGLRHHPGENILRLMFTTFAVIITGASFGLVMMYQTISVFFAHLSHANINLPRTFERVLSYVLVTPHFHKVHHHYVQPYTDSNYGNIFSFWDYCFGTVNEFEKIDDLIYGIDTHMDSDENSSLTNLLLIPFQSYRFPINHKIIDK